MDTPNIMRGTPPPIFMPARNYKFKVVGNNYLIKLPRKGSYHELDPDFFKEDDGEFNIFDDETKTLHMPSITKVLFGTCKYPDLPDNHYFAPYAFQIVDDGILMVGQVLEILDGGEEKES